MTNLTSSRVQRFSLRVAVMGGVEIEEARVWVLDFDLVGVRALWTSLGKRRASFRGEMERRDRIRFGFGGRIADVLAAGEEAAAEIRHYFFLCFFEVVVEHGALGLCLGLGRDDEGSF